MVVVWFFYSTIEFNQRNVKLCLSKAMFKYFKKNYYVVELFVEHIILSYYYLRNSNSKILHANCVRQCIILQGGFYKISRVVVWAEGATFVVINMG